MNRLFDWFNQKAIAGTFPCTKSAAEIAAMYQDNPVGIDSMIRWEASKAATLGAITASFVLASFLTIFLIVVSVPLSIWCAMVIQTRLAAAIAILCGEATDKERTRGLASVATNAAVAGGIKNMVATQGVRGAGAAVAATPVAILQMVNRAVGMRLVTKAGQTSLIRLTTWVPIVGIILCGLVDWYSCIQVGKAARLVFTRREP